MELALFVIPATKKLRTVGITAKNEQRRHTKRLEGAQTRTKKAANRRQSKRTERERLEDGHWLT